MDIAKAQDTILRTMHRLMDKMGAQPKPLDLVALGISEPPPPPRPRSATSIRRDPDNLVPIATLLCIWRLCGRAACHKSRTCRGAPSECLEACAPLVPEAACGWIVELMKRKELSYTFEEAVAAIPYENQAVFAAWRAVALGKARVEVQ